MICKHCGTEYSGESALGTLGHNKGECRDVLVAQLAAERERREAAEQSAEFRGQLNDQFNEQLRIALAAQKQAEERAERMAEAMSRAREYLESYAGSHEMRMLRALAALAPQPADERSPAWCDVHQHYKWCEHNGGVLGRTGHEQPADERGEEKRK